MIVVGFPAVEVFGSSLLPVLHCRGAPSYTVFDVTSQGLQFVNHVVMGLAEMPRFSHIPHVAC